MYSVCTCRWFGRGKNNGLRTIAVTNLVVLLHFVWQAYSCAKWARLDIHIAALHGYWTTLSKGEPWWWFLWCLSMSNSCEGFHREPWCPESAMLTMYGHFSGHGNFERTCREKLKSCTPIDVLLNAQLHNLLTEFGFFYILTVLLSVVSCLHWNQFEHTSKIWHQLHSLTYLFLKFYTMSHHGVHAWTRFQKALRCWGRHVVSSYSYLHHTTSEVGNSPMATRTRKRSVALTNWWSTCWYCWL